MNAGVRAEERCRLVHAHHQHVADALAFVADRQRILIEALSLARLAHHSHVWQEAHLDLAQTLSFARFALSAMRVERKPRRAVSAHAGIVRFSKDATHVVPESDVRGRAWPRRLTDRRLIDLEHTTD